MKRLLLFLPTVLVILGLGGCDEFFPSESSVNTVTLSPTNIFMKAAEQQQFTATQTTIGGTSSDVSNTATWTSSNNTVASVNTSGLATAGTVGSGLGTATISAKSGGVTGSTTVAVANGKLTGITVGPSNPILTVGNTLQVTATGNFDSNVASQTITGLVSWTTSDSTIATINSSGLATAVKAGQVTFTATATVTGGTTVTGTLNVTVQ